MINIDRLCLCFLLILRVLQISFQLYQQFKKLIVIGGWALLATTQYYGLLQLNAAFIVNNKFIFIIFQASHLRAKSERFYQPIVSRCNDGDALVGQNYAIPLVDSFVNFALVHSDFLLEFLEFNFQNAHFNISFFEVIFLMV